MLSHMPPPAAPTRTWLRLEGSDRDRGDTTGSGDTARAIGLSIGNFGGPKFAPDRAQRRWRGQHLDGFQPGLGQTGRLGMRRARAGRIGARARLTSFDRHRRQRSLALRKATRLHEFLKPLERLAAGRPFRVRTAGGSGSVR
jgi:hypothetical protein